MIIYTATPAYAEALYAIECACYSTPWSRETIEYELGDPSVAAFVAAEDEIVGYTFVRRSFETGHIENIAVESASRGRGVASRLVQTVIDWALAAGLDALTLEVRQGNRAAMGLYHKFGFIVEGYRRDYYKDPTEDAVLMIRKLKE